MAETPKIEGPINDDTKIQPEEVVTQEIVNLIVTKVHHDWEVVGYKAKMGTQLGDNFMSIIYAASIDVRSKGDKDKKETLDVMVKTMPRNTGRVQMINDSGAFSKEIKMYEEVLPAMINFQIEKGFRDEDIFRPWPKLYASRGTDAGFGDYLALQDLRTLQYGMACRHKGLGLEESKLVLRSLGKFHAISYVQFRGDFDSLMTAYPYLEEKLFQAPAKADEITKQWVKETYMREAKMIREKDSVNTVYADAIENLYSDTFWEDMHKLTSKWTQFATITHSDCWTNNFLFKFDKMKKPIDLKFIDFQMCRIGSRCLDLGYFMHTSPQAAILNEQEEELLSEYFEAFKGFATKLGYFDPKLTLEQLFDEYNRYRLYGVAMGLMLAPLITAQSGAIPDLETLPEDEEELMSEESQNIWFGNLDKEKATYDKIMNLAIHHMPKLTK